MEAGNSFYKREIHLFCIGELRTDGWKSGWRQELERRCAEEKPSRITAPQIQVRQKRAEGCNPNPRYQAAVPTKFCDGCGKGLRKSTVGTKCQPCLRARPKCACGRTVSIVSDGDQCKECLRRDNRKPCAICPALLNAGNAYGLCKAHYEKYRHFIHQDELVKCADCDTQILKKNRFGRCMKHAKNLYNQSYRAKARELKRAA